MKKLQQKPTPSKLRSLFRPLRAIRAALNGAALFVWGSEPATFGGLPQNLSDPKISGPQRGAKV